MTLQTRLVYLIAILYGASFWAFPPHDPDLGWHLLGGRYVLEHGGAPTLDFINSFNINWIDYHWLAQALMRLIYNSFGFEGLRISLGILLAYLSKIVIDIIYRSTSIKASPARVLFLYFLTVTFIGEVTAIRPQMIALVFVALAVKRLLSPPSKMELPYIALLTVLAANMHVYWIFIPFLWLTYRVLPRFYRSRFQSAIYSWGGFAFLFLSGLLLTPYGVFAAGKELQFGVLTNGALLLEYALTTSEMRNSIGELKSSLAADGLVPLLILLTVAIGFGAIRLSRMRGKLSDFIGFIAGLSIAVRTLKFLSVFGIIGLPYLARSSGRLWRTLFRSANVRLIERILLPVLALTAGVIAFTSLPAFNPAANFLTEVPVEACSKIPHLQVPNRPGRDHVRVLTHFDYGGWCRFGAFEDTPNFDMRVTTDGRTQFVPPDHFTKSFDLFRLNYEWSKTLAAWDPDVALVEKNRALGQFMLHARSFWKLVYEDEKFAVFLPVRAVS